MSLDNWLNIVSILISTIITIIVYKLSRKLSSRDRYNHEIYITNQLREYEAVGKNIILADVKKYDRKNKNFSNQDYHKQRCGLFNVVPVYGISVYLDSVGKKIGNIPFEWIKYVRPSDSEDAKVIVVCNFKGVKWYKNFKSPFEEVIDIK